MTRRTAAAAAAVVITVTAAAMFWPRDERPLPDDFERGAAVTAWSPQAYARPAAREALTALKAAGATHATLIVTWYADGPLDGDVHADPARTPSDASLLAAMSHARRLGLEVVLKPHVDLEDGTPRAAIDPANRAGWAQRYGRLLERAARLAQRGGAQMLVVGTELTALSRDEHVWRELIARARAVYRGRLTFAANWDAAEDVRFWDALDLIGVDAYQPLARADEHPTTEQLVEAWQRPLDRLGDLARRTGRRVIATELGYQARRGAAARPWDATGPPDAALQQRLYEAAFRAWGRREWVAGIHLWDWPGDPAANDGGFSPRGLPAQRTLEHWYG